MAYAIPHHHYYINYPNGNQGNWQPQNPWLGQGQSVRQMASINSIPIPEPAVNSSWQVQGMRQMPSVNAIPIQYSQAPTVNSLGVIANSSVNTISVQHSLPTTQSSEIVANSTPVLVANPSASNIPIQHLQPPTAHSSVIVANSS